MGEYACVVLTGRTGDLYHLAPVTRLAGVRFDVLDVAPASGVSMRDIHTLRPDGPTVCGRRWSSPKDSATTFPPEGYRLCHFCKRALDTVELSGFAGASWTVWP